MGRRRTRKNSLALVSLAAALPVAVVGWVPRTLPMRTPLLPPLRGLILPGEEGYDALVPGAGGKAEGDAAGGAEPAAAEDEDKESALEGTLAGKVKEMSDKMMGTVWAKDRPAFGICAATGRSDEFVMGSELPQNEQAAADWRAICEKQGVSRVLALFDDCIAEEAEADATEALLVNAGFDASRVATVFLSIDGSKDALLDIIDEAKNAEASDGGGSAGSSGGEGLDLSGLGGDFRRTLPRAPDPPECGDIRRCINKSPFRPDYPITVPERT